MLRSTQPDPEFCTIREAADYLAMTERSIARFIANGTLPAARIGTKQIRLRVSDVKALLVPIAPKVAKAVSR